MQTPGPATQDWTHSLPLMQQSVLLSAIRGPDGNAKYGCVKMLLRWLRRCVLRSALDGGIVLDDPADPRGGSFTGPSFDHGTDCLRRQLDAQANTGSLDVYIPLPLPRPWEEIMNDLVGEYLKASDGLPFHYWTHFMHAAQILGSKHPDTRIRAWWNACYARLVHSLHLNVESEEQLDKRLGDNRDSWLERADPATTD